jgi:endogenous inhibitor of DNA gyrase (YacG/DUF329 family)
VSDIYAWDKTRFVCDEHGQWWYLAGRDRSRRDRVTPRDCERCGRAFLPSGSAAQVRFCSRKCGVTAAHARKIPKVVATGVPSDIKVQGNRDRFSKDEQGQWWWTGGGYRLKTEVAKCGRCGAEFLAPHNRKSRSTPFCSKKCGVRSSYDSLAKEDRTYANARAWRGGKVYRRGYVLVLAPDHPSLVGTTRRYVLEHRIVMEQILGRYLEPHEQVHHKNGVTDDNRPENLELWALRRQPPGQRAHEQQHCQTFTCHLKKDA